MPLTINTTLAKAIGLNEAIILQQIKYWLQRSSHHIDGYTWIYNSIPKWQEQFSFWSYGTIKRTIASLENQGLVVSGNFNKLKIDRTKWYRIVGYEDVNQPTMSANCTHQKVSLHLPIPETTTETTHKDIQASQSSPADAGDSDKPTEYPREFILEEKLQQMEKTEGSYLDHIASFIRYKKLKPESSRELSAIIGRYSRIAKTLEAYTSEKLWNAMKQVEEDNAKRKDKINWTLDTVFKQLTK